MSTSGRDRDPAFRRQKTTGKPAARPVKKPASPAPKKEETPASPEVNKETPTTTPPVTPKPETKATNTPAPDSLTTPVVEPQRKVQPALVYDEDSKPKKEKIVVPPPVVTKTEKPVETKTSSGTVPPPPPTKPPSSEKPDKGSGKRKMLGILMAIVFIVGMGTIGYYMVNNIMEKEKNRSNSEISDNKSNENADDEGTAHAGDVSMEESENANSEEGVNENSDGEMRETTLTDQNSLENEMNESSNENSSDAASDNSGQENTEKQEKQALSKVIRKKGDFEIPCWIVAFSANNKKPLANMNYSALEALGFDAGIYWIPKYFPGGQSMYKVYVGPYKTPEEAQAILPQIKNLQPDAYVMKIDEE